VAAVADAIEARHAVVAAGYRLPIDNAGARVQTRQRLDDRREAPRQVVPRPAVEPHPCAILTCDDPEAVLLDWWGGTAG
jgi:hypothetical protein